MACDGIARKIIFPLLIASSRFDVKFILLLNSIFLRIGCLRVDSISLDFSSYRCQAVTTTPLSANDCAIALPHVPQPSTETFILILF